MSVRRCCGVTFHGPYIYACAARFRRRWPMRRWKPIPGDHPVCRDPATGLRQEHRL